VRAPSQAERRRKAWPRHAAQEPCEWPPGRKIESSLLSILVKELQPLFQPRFPHVRRHGDRDRAYSPAFQAGVWVSAPSRCAAVRAACLLVWSPSTCPCRAQRKCGKQHGHAAFQVATLSRRVGIGPRRLARSHNRRRKCDCLLTAMRELVHAPLAAPLASTIRKR
jgi:hypothetical protein